MYKFKCLKLKGYSVLQISIPLKHINRILRNLKRGFHPSVKKLLLYTEKGLNIMKNKAMLGLMLFIIMFLVPFISMGAKIPDKTKTSPSSPKSSQNIESQKAEKNKESKKVENNTEKKPQNTADKKAENTSNKNLGFKILDTKSNKVITADDRSFLYGAIATEMSPTYNVEALKAQGVAAYTYYSRLRSQQRANPTPSLKGADFSADTQGWQIYVTKQQMQDRWGSNFNTYYSTLTKAVDSIYGQVLKSGDELADSTYYAISSGNTESSEDVWGGKLDYLVPVASPGDIYSSGYQTSATFPVDKFKTCALKINSKIKFSGDASTWIKNITRTSSGTVKTMQICGTTVTGNDVRSAFGLRSANFTVSYSNGNFEFTVKGYGHGVGMSQVGAQYMAQQGSNYKQILSWYYPKTTLTNM